MPEYIPPTPSDAVRDMLIPADELDQLGILIRVMARLRAPDGCPWDRAQTQQSLLPNLLEESYEFLHAVQTGDAPAMREELGDILLQVIFHAQIGAEAGNFNLGDCARELSEKLVRRHPHVFGDAKAEDQRDALASWHAAKRNEGKHTVDLEDVPRAMPALLRARKVQEKAAKVGFEWPGIEGALAKVEEELGELRKAMDSLIPPLLLKGGQGGVGVGPNEMDAAENPPPLLKGEPGGVEEELGDLLFAVVNVARYLHVCPEVALVGTVEKFIRRFKFIEERLAKEGLTPAEVTLEKMDGYWEEAKRGER